MKKIALLLTLMLIATFGSFAQSYQEVVYLDDGTILKGIILEQVPNDYLKIETSSGKIYTIDMRKVEKITKERPRTNTQSYNRSTPVERRNTQNYNRSTQNYNRSTQSPTRRQYNNNQYTYSRNSPIISQPYNDDYDYYGDYSYFPNRGYKGFIDLGFSFGTNTRININDRNRSYTESTGGVHRFEFSTSHGFFLSPYFFLGAGAGIHFYTGYSDDDGNYQSFDEVDLAIPIFAHVRTHFIDKKVSPFVDVKLGYSVSEITGAYFSPSVGCRFMTGSRSAFWISMGYTLQHSGEDYYNYNTSTNFDAFSVKIGWDF